MTAAFWLAMCLAYPPDDVWVFHDRAQREGRSVVTFRTVELTDAPAQPLHAQDQPAPGAKYGTIALGHGGKLRLGLVFHAASNIAWLDADADGRFAVAERFMLGEQLHEVTVKAPFGDKLATRTLLIRKRGDGVAYGVRGYTEGSVRLGGKRVAALLIDGDADGCFDGAGADRVWLDLDGNGKFDPLTEQFALGTIVNHAGVSFLIRPRPDGLAVAVNERPAAFGTLAFSVSKQPGAPVVELSAQLVSEWGELVTVKHADKPLSVPIGKYRIDSVALKLAGQDGKTWHYGFSAADSVYGIEIAKGALTRHGLLANLQMTVSLDSTAGIAGGSVLIHPQLATADRLFMTRCEVAERYADRGREIHATLKLTGPGNVVLDQAASGFN